MAAAPTYAGGPAKEVIVNGLREIQHNGGTKRKEMLSGSGMADTSI